jgi:hypothetical protein
LLSGTFALANNVRTDYDHGANFSSYHTYSWGTVKTSNPLNEDRVKAAVDKDLQAKGWQLVASGGSATVFANGNVKDIFDASSHHLLFRGVADDDLSNNAGKNTKNMDKDISDMLKKFPPKS